MSIAEEKAALRKQFKALRKACSDQERVATGQAIPCALFSSRAMNLFDRCRCFVSYLHTPEEVSTDELHHTLFTAQMPVAVPRFDVDLQAYTWAALRPGEPLVRGPMRILEPTGKLPFQTAEVTAAFIPGVAFDKYGGRLGYGGGIYDRLLRKLRPSVIKIALAFDCQISATPLPQEAHDLAMDYIVTGTHWIDCRKAKTAIKK